jgi:hypothetical protein
MSSFLAEIAFRLYTWVLPLAQLTFAGALLILVPLALIPATRGQAGKNFIIASYLFGFTTWMLGATITFSTYGWVGLLIGLFFFGVGVVPVAVVAAFFSLSAPGLGFSLIMMAVLTYGARMGGAALMEAAARREAEREGARLA